MISLNLSLAVKLQRLTIPPLLMVAFEARQIVTPITLFARPAVAVWRQACPARAGSMLAAGYAHSLPWTRPEAAFCPGVWALFPNWPIFMAVRVARQYIPSPMESNNNNFNGLNDAFLALLKPLARLFLHFGRGFREFSELSKTAFVAVASDDYGIGGRPTNGSRIAAMTGISRKEISRLRQKIGLGRSAALERQSPVQEALNVWRSDAEFLDQRGIPASLPMNGQRASFEALVKRCAGDIPAGAMRKELQRIGAIDIVGTDVRMRSELPDRSADEAELEAQLRSGPYPLLAALASERGERKNGYCQPHAAFSRSLIRSSEVPEVRTQIAQRLRSANKHLADLLNAYEVRNAEHCADEPTVPISAGVFYAEAIDSSDT